MRDQERLQLGANEARDKGKNKEEGKNKDRDNGIDDKDKSKGDDKDKDRDNEQGKSKDRKSGKKSKKGVPNVLEDARRRDEQEASVVDGYNNWLRQVSKTGGCGCLFLCLLWVGDG